MAVVFTVRLAGAPLVSNGSFESNAIGTRVEFTAPGIDATTFAGWRIFSVGSPPVASFSGRIVDAADFDAGGVSGKHVMRLELDHSGPAAGFDYGLDGLTGLVPVAYGNNYTFSYAAVLYQASVPDVSLLEVGLAEFGASGALIDQTVFTTALPSDSRFHSYSNAWTPLSRDTAHVCISFRPRSPGTQCAMGVTDVELAAMGVSPRAAADSLNLPAIISDHMVLQKTARVPVWGKANPGEEVAVTLNGQTAKADADANGKWTVWLNLQNSPAGPFEMTVSGKTDKITISDVLVGEVWLASGQSNMQIPLSQSIGAIGEITRSANPSLRQFQVVRNASAIPLDDCQGRWMVASAQASADFSAVGYYFAKRLQNELNIPVGLIHASHGGTQSEAWTSAPALGSIPELKASQRAHSSEWDAVKDVPDKRQHYISWVGNSLLFNAMIHPVLPYAIKGVIWYQGEGNTVRSWQYRTAFPLLITDWRAQWKQGDLPFYYCQLAPFEAKQSQPVENAWAELREAQSATLKLPKTGQAVLIDIGEANDIHPRNKKDVGERLAKIALAKDYGKDIPFSGPVYQSFKVEGGGIRLNFTHTDGGLVARPLPSTYDVQTLTGTTAPLVRNSPNSDLEGFAICGDDRKWVWADAKIEGDTILVCSAKVPAPIAVRYAWAGNPTCNLYNGAGLPASPFRTDDFPATTRDAKW